MVHGDHDEDVSVQWGKNTHKTLKERGVKTTLQILKGMPHHITKDGILTIKQWITTNFDN